MWPRNWISGTADVSLELDKWAGCVAQAWGYSVSHSQLLIRLYREEGSQRSRTSLYLYLKDCNKVSFMDGWRNVQITIEEQAGKFGTEYVLADGDRFYTHCGVTPFAAESEEFLRFQKPVLGTEIAEQDGDGDA